ncbi:MAG: hypothetical protein DMF60_05150 [Acidobacteria bacterium]|nr:MAG: hypothetical protein DMF60_05150 [Acidobacteriota bacterium]
MATLTAKEIYEQLVKRLPPEERLQLIEMVNRDLLESASKEPQKNKRSLMELHGLGAKIWQGIDAQEYVDELRKEWDHRL